MRDKETPLKLVRLLEKMDKDCYRQLDRCLAAKDEGQMWASASVPPSADPSEMTVSSGFSSGNNIV